jgi:hypothetical protein
MLPYVGIFTVLAVFGFLFAACNDGSTPTKNPGHTHQWGEWTITRAATCIAEGEETRVCALDATHKETKTIAVDLVNGHDWEWVLTTDPTYFTEGVETGTCKHDHSHTTTRPVQTSQYITSVADLTEYLATQTGTVESPVFLPLQIDLGTMTETDSGWRQLLDAIEAADKFVDLDLSACTMAGTEFNTDYTVETGKAKIVSIALPAGVTSIGKLAFYGFTGLTQVTLPEGLTSIGEYAFEECTALEQVTLPDSLTSIGNGAFSYLTALTQITLPEGLISIGDRAFSGSTLTQITLPEGLISIGDGAFSYCTALKQTTLPASLTSFGGYVFDGCTKLTQVTLSEGLTSIGGSAFYNTGLTQITLPSSLTSIGSGAFINTGLTQITLPAGLASINGWAFTGCTYLSLVTCLPVTTPTLGSAVFSYQNNTPLPNLRIEVPAGSVATYKAATGWSAYADRIFAIGE